MTAKILLVDDTETYLKAYGTRLTEEGYQVTVASNGVEALKALTTEKPDLVLLDLVMPIMDGFKVLRMIKNDANLRSVPVVVFTAKGGTKEIFEAMEAGATDYLIKANSSPDEVVKTAKKYLSP